MVIYISSRITFDINVNSKGVNVNQKHMLGSTRPRLAVFNSAVYDVVHWPRLLSDLLHLFAAIV